MLDKFDPTLRITDDKFNEVVFSLLNTMFAYLQSIHRRIIEIECKLDPSLTAKELADRYSEDIDELFDHVMTEILVRYGE